jgi:hypothetical protein
VDDHEPSTDEQPADGEPSGRLRRFLDARFASSRRAALALAGTFVAFHLVAWLFHELTNPGHRDPASFTAHLRHLPDELLLQVLFMPIAMHFAIPALFHSGSLFAWSPGYVAPRVFAVTYWFTLLAASTALVRGQRKVWLGFIGVVLLATAPRFAELIMMALSEN